MDCAVGCAKLTHDVLKSFWKFYICLELFNLSGPIHVDKPEVFHNISAPGLLFPSHLLSVLLHRVRDIFINSTSFC